jgi:hypothetical protein
MIQKSLILLNLFLLLWDLHKEFVPLGSNINSEMNKNILDRLCKRIKRVKPVLWKDWSFFLLKA